MVWVESFAWQASQAIDILQSTGAFSKEQRGLLFICCTSATLTLTLTDIA